MLVRDASQEEQGLETENCLHLEQDLIAGPTCPLHALLGGVFAFDYPTHLSTFVPEYGNAKSCDSHLCEFQTWLLA
jgi:hypothetical protein